MQKTRMGISVALMGVAMFLVTYFGGFLAALVLAGYILLCEENVWLKKAAVKAVSLAIAFSLISGLLYLLPNVIGFINSVAMLFDENVTVEFIDKLMHFFTTTLDIGEKVLFFLLAFKALSQGTIKIPVIDPLIEKHMA